MISITKTSPDASNNSVMITNYKKDSKLTETPSRVSKTKTLDGGVVVVHSGYVELDRSFIVRATMNETDVVTLRSILASETFVMFAFDDGVYDAAITNFREKGGEVRMTVEPKEKLSA